MMTTPYTAQQPITDYSLRFTNLLYSSSLSASTDTQLTVPGTAPKYKAVIKVSALTWVALNQTAAIPAGNTFASTTSEMVNSGYVLCREVNAGDIIHFFTTTANTNVSVAFYAVGSNN